MSHVYVLLRPISQYGKDTGIPSSLPSCYLESVLRDSLAYKLCGQSSRGNSVGLLQLIQLCYFMSPLDFISFDAIRCVLVAVMHVLNC